MKTILVSLVAFGTMAHALDVTLTITIPDNRLPDLIQWRNGQVTTQTTTTGNVTAAVATIPLVSVAGISVGTHLLCQLENMTVIAVGANSVTVTRGTMQTTAAAHISGSGVAVLRFGTMQEVLKAIARIGYRTAVLGENAPSLGPQRDAVVAAQAALQAAIDGAVQ
jgi:hypothetical protein